MTRANRPAGSAVTLDTPPLVIIGAGRSGTNMLRDCLTRLDGLVTWPCDEINYIWRYGNRSEPTDEFPASLARSEVIDFIRSRFADIARRQGTAQGSVSPIVVEKTCANSLRVPFIDAVLPEARYLYLVRDGRDVINSVMQRWKAPLDLRYIAAKARYVPVTDLPYYAGSYALNRLKKLRSKEGALSVWGPRFQGMQDIAAKEDLRAVCAAQWARCIEKSDQAFENIASNRVLRIHYEDFVKSPVENLEAVAAFVERPISTEDAARAAAEVRVGSVGKGSRAFDSGTLSFMQNALSQHGYN